jgi:3-oxoacyl-[acyl-carrier protein] reductase
MQTGGMLARHEWNHGRRENLIGMTPLRRIPRPKELAGPAFFFATAETRHVTGVYMMCNGGHSMDGA